MIDQSLTDIGAAMSRSTEVMSQTLQSAANSNFQNQSLFYQQDRQQFIPGPFTQMLNQPFLEPQNTQPGPGSSYPNPKLSSYGAV